MKIWTEIKLLGNIAKFKTLSEEAKNKMDLLLGVKEILHLRFYSITSTDNVKHCLSSKKY